MRLFTTFLILVSFFMTVAYGQTVGKQLEFNSAMGIRYESNLVKNPSAYKNGQHVTASALASCARSTTAGNVIDGKASWLLQSTLITNNCEFELLTPSSEQVTGNCGFAGIFKGSAAAWSAQIQDGSNNTLAKTVFTNESGWRAFVLWHPCGAAGTRKVKIVNSESGTINPVNVGLLYYGRMEPGAGVPPNTFVASISSTGTVTDETPGYDWINSCSVADTSRFTCTFTTSFFTSTPVCEVTPALTADLSPNGISVVLVNNGTNASQVQYRTSNSGSNSALNAKISCTKTGSDYIQPAITPNQWNFETRNSTPTFSNLGFTPGINRISYYRKGDRLFVDGITVFASGTGSGSTLTLTIPEGLSIDTTKLGTSSGLQTFGSWSWYDDTGSSGTLDDNWGPVTYVGSTSVAFRIPNTSNQFVTSVMAANDSLSFNFNVPIVGWTENQGAPQLVGSVTSNSSSALREEYAFVHGATSSSNCTSSPCTIGGTGLISTPGWLSSVTRGAAGIYTFTIASGVYAAGTTPHCDVSVYGANSNAGLPVLMVYNPSATTNSVEFYQTYGTQGYYDVRFKIRCIGQRP